MDDHRDTEVLGGAGGEQIASYGGAAHARDDDECRPRTANARLGDERQCLPALGGEGREDLPHKVRIALLVQPGFVERHLGPTVSSTLSSSPSPGAKATGHARRRAVPW